MQSLRQIKSTARGWSAVSLRSSSNRQAQEELQFAHPGSVRRRRCFCGLAYAPEDIYVSDSKTGSIIKLAFIPVSSGHAKMTQVISGFGVNKGSGWSILGPSGIQYNSTRTGNLCNDTLYIVDGVDNTVVAVSNASNLLEKDEIVVQPGGKKFKCAHPTKTCATLVYSGSPLNAPVASALLPNGNLIVANTQGRKQACGADPGGEDTRHQGNRHEHDCSRLRTPCYRHER